MQSELCNATREVIVRSKGRAMPPDNLHLTLAFLGSVPEPALPRLIETAHAAASDYPDRSIAVTLDAIDYWRKPQLLCAVSAEAYAVAALANPLRGSIIGAGFAPDLKPFRAHVTLARKVPSAPKQSGTLSVRWTFERLALMESRTGPHGSIYSMVDSWALCGS
jgi:RNA 2',3'-cyclic 3'-phosphodiesterase